MINLIKEVKSPIEKKMKLALNLYLCLFTLFTFVQKSFSLTNYQITKICKKEKRSSTCIKKLQDKRYNLQKGNLIEIPVIHHKK